MADPANERPIPSWFDSAKLGIFIHWTASAIPGYAPLPQSPILQHSEDWPPSEQEAPDGKADGASTDAGVFDFPVDTAEWGAMPEAEMYHHFMNQPDTAIARYHTEHYGDLEFGAVVERFRTTMIPGWDPEVWAEMFARAGARYVVLCTKVEHGFLMWPSSTPNPYQANWQSDRDVVGELAAAVRARGLRFGVYYSGGWDFTFGGADGTWMSEMMPSDPEYTRYVENRWHELIERSERPVRLGPAADSMVRWRPQGGPSGRFRHTGDVLSRLAWRNAPKGTLIELPEPLDRRPACTFRLTPAELVKPLKGYGR